MTDSAYRFYCIALYIPEILPDSSEGPHSFEEFTEFEQINSTSENHEMGAVEVNEPNGKLFSYSLTYVQNSQSNEF